MKKSLKIITILLIILIALSIIIFLILTKNEEEKFISIKSEDELYSIYDSSDMSSDTLWKYALGMPFSILHLALFNNSTYTTRGYDYSSKSDLIPLPMNSESTYGASSESSENDYSKTNVQVENVDEADITKTDGKYIYSISDDNVVITDVQNPKDIKIVSKFNAEEATPPVDLILTENMLTVISKTSQSSQDTYVSIFNVTNKEKPVLEKSFSLYQPYFTSRCINGRLYVITNGKMKSTNYKKVDREYEEDGVIKEIALQDFKRMGNNKTHNETIIATVDLKNIKKDVKVSAYLINTSNAYVSEHNIYTTNYEHNSNSGPSLKDIFGLKGVFGLVDYEEREETNKTKTSIFKFAINDDELNYVNKATVDGQVINQYSIDEKNNHLRIATYDTDGTRVTIFDDNMKQLGQTDRMAKGEKMYASRFIGDKAYLITYKNIDPLFVIDLSNEQKPRSLGELKISGYSTYLHPYDENHLIGIGMETTTTSDYGVVSTTRITGMKMALFDVSDVSHPVTIAKTVIGDSNTTSAILDNPKALLFSKEKELLAIPLNNYLSGFTANTYGSNDVESIIQSYKSQTKSRNSEGYAVYKINLKDGFELKGIIKHQNDYIQREKNTNARYSTDYYSSMIRGAYIKDNLFTISDDEIRVNAISDLRELSSIRIREKTTYDTFIQNNYQ